jgi:alkanesulfonate monooxygenase SsuD/methylene tetrahydromethanopterin reductase-like flavin-dependent oxidoreductase (luciferase family)
MLDQISGGRLEFGVARGFVRNDYDTMGVGWDDAQRRLEEGLEVVLRAWQERPFSYTGQYYAFREVSVWPLPLQSPHPPVWGAATVSPSTFEWIGGQGFNLLTVSHLKSLPEMDGLIGAYRAAAEAAGHDPRGLQVSMHFQVYCAEDRDEALREGGEARKRYIALADSVRLRGNVLAPPREELPIEQMVAESRICIGTPDDCAEVIERARRHLNLTQVDCSFYFGGLDYEKAQRSFRLFASEVMPRFRTASAALPGR